MLTLSVLLGLVFVQVVPSLAQPTGTLCPSAPGRSESCVCKSDKGVIDVTSLSKKDGTPMYVKETNSKLLQLHQFMICTMLWFHRFTGLQDPNDFSYSYNPCQPYSGQSDCNTVHVSLYIWHTKPHLRTSHDAHVRPIPRSVRLQILTLLQTLTSLMLIRSRCG